MSCAFLEVAQDACREGDVRPMQEPPSPRGGAIPAAGSRRLLAGLAAHRGPCGPRLRLRRSGAAPRSTCARHPLQRVRAWN